MPRYAPGDVVLVYFPWETEDGTLDYKKRPAVVRSFEGDSDRLLIQITSTNRSDKLPGIWVTKDSKEGEQMGILSDSFINVGTQRVISLRDIDRLIGFCPYMEEIEQLIDDNDISRPWE